MMMKYWDHGMELIPSLQLGSITFTFHKWEPQFDGPVSDISSIGLNISLAAFSNCKVDC